MFPGTAIAILLLVTGLQPEGTIMSKTNKNDMAKDPEDQMKEFPRGTKVEGALHPEEIEESPADPRPKGRRQPTKAGAAAERQGRTTQEGAAEQTS